MCLPTVCEDHHFKDEFLYYRFKNDEKPSKNALGRLKKSKRPGSATLSSSDANERTSVASFDSAIYAGDNHLSAGSSNTPPPDDDDEWVVLKLLRETQLWTVDSSLHK